MTSMIESKNQGFTNPNQGFTNEYNTNHIKTFGSGKIKEIMLGTVVFMIHNQNIS